MEMRQIQIVLAVAKHSSFGDAAWETAVAASTVSRYVQTLEQELGVSLFERNGRSKVTLTPEGEKLIPELQNLADYAQSLLRHAELLRETENSMRLRIGCPNGLSTLGEDEILIDFNAVYPDIAIEQIVSNKPKELWKQLQYGELDAFFTMRPWESRFEKIEENSCVEQIVLEKLHLNLALPAHHTAIQDGKVSLAALKDEVFLFRAFSPDMRRDPNIQCFISACEKEGFEAKVSFQQMRTSAMFDMVVVGQGILPLMYVPRTIYPGVTIVPSTNEDYAFAKVLYYKKEKQSKALKRFLKFLLQSGDI